VNSALRAGAREALGQAPASGGRGSSWRVDETYMLIRGKWIYGDRVIDKEDLAIDILL
jgi:transposase-like protein